VADISLSKRPQYGITNCVHKHIRIRVPIEPFPVRDLHSAQNELPSLDQLVNIVTYPDMIHVGEYMGGKSATKPFRHVAPSRQRELPCAFLVKKDFGESTTSSHHRSAI
jgi:hypothetical protein